MVFRTGRRNLINVVKLFGKLCMCEPILLTFGSSVRILFSSRPFCAQLFCQLFCALIFDPTFLFRLPSCPPSMVCGTCLPVMVKTVNAGGRITGLDIGFLAQGIFVSSFEWLLPVSAFLCL